MFAAFRFRRLFRGVLPVLLLLVLASDTLAFGRRCGGNSGNSTNNRVAPVRNLIGGVLDRVQARRGGGCGAQAGTTSSPTPGEVTYHALPAGGYTIQGAAGCVNGVCPAPVRVR